MKACDHCGREHRNLRGACDRCEGRGYCRDRLQAETSRSVLEMTFGRFRGRGQAATAAKRLLEWVTSAANGKTPPGAILTGAVGTGKTHLMRAVWNALIFDQPIERSWVTLTAFVQEGRWFDLHKLAMREDSEISRTVLLEQAQRAQLLCWDDLGVQPRGDRGWVDELLYLVFDARYQERRATLISTNLDLTKPCAGLSERVRDRILGLVRDPHSGRPRILALGGASYRQTQGQEPLSGGDVRG